MYTVKNPAAFYSLLGIALFDAALISSVFYHVGDKNAVAPPLTIPELRNYRKVEQNQVGVVFFVVIDLFQNLTLY